MTTPTITMMSALTKTTTMHWYSNKKSNYGIPDENNNINKEANNNVNEFINRDVDDNNSSSSNYNNHIHESYDNIYNN